MNRHCPECGADMTLKNHEHEERVGGYKVRDPSGMAYVCVSCGAADLSLEGLQEYERRAARVVLLDRPDAGGAVYKYARKALGLRQVDLAALLKVEPETVSRWENDQRPMPRAEQLALVALLTGVECGLVDIAKALRAGPVDTSKELVVRPTRAA